MRGLIIHQNFPGQFRHVAKASSERPGWQLVGIGRDTAPGLPELEKTGRLTLIRYKPHRQVQGGVQIPFGPAQKRLLVTITPPSRTLKIQLPLNFVLACRPSAFVPNAPV